MVTAQSQHDCSSLRRVLHRCVTVACTMLGGNKTTTVLETRSTIPSHPIPLRPLCFLPVVQARRNEGGGGRGRCKHDDMGTGMPDRHTQEGDSYASWRGVGEAGAKVRQQL